VFGLDESRRHVERLLDRAMAAVTPLGEPAAPLAQMARTLATRTR
jgi:hypothetical protein